jgi:hypothetical protein
MTMKRLSVLVAVLALGAAACSKSSTSPSTSTPTNPTFTADLRPANEVPAITNGESGGSGTMTITFVVTRDSANNVTAATANFNGTFSSFPAGTALTAAHIHPGATGVNGSPLVNLALTQGQITFANGTGSLSVNNVSMTPEVAQQILANPAGYYFNIHTALNPGGVARGQLVRVQ